MTIKLSITAVLIALTADLFIGSLFSFPIWLPYFSISIAPALLTLSKDKVPILTTIFLVFFLWILSGVNLGIALLASGILYIICKDLVPGVFHTTTWHASAVYSAALAIFFCVLALGTQRLSPPSLLTTRFVVSSVLTVILSFIISLTLQKRYA